MLNFKRTSLILYQTKSIGNSYVCLSVLCLWVFSTARLLNLACVIVNRSHVFSLRAAEKDLSPVALVAGFTLKKFTDG